jgi:hypothetical protein
MNLHENARLGVSNKNLVLTGTKGQLDFVFEEEEAKHNELNK